MNCPNCESPKLKTIETFQTADMTYRTKICPTCKWKFTSHEVIAENQVIPLTIRKPHAASQSQRDNRVGLIGRPPLTKEQII